MNPITIHRRSFSASKYAVGTPERDALNRDPLTSEYFTSHKYAIRRVALMSDGSQNPSQRYHTNTFRTKAEAILAANTWSAWQKGQP